MKAWCDLSWREKCDIEEGNVDAYKYFSGYTFDVKTKVQDGKKRKEKAHENDSPRKV